MQLGRSAPSATGTASKPRPSSLSRIRSQSLHVPPSQIPAERQYSFRIFSTSGSARSRYRLLSWQRQQAEPCGGESLKLRAVYTDIQLKRDERSQEMRDSRNVFHLAIPCRDLDEAHAFYVDGLGCRLARRYSDRITLDFFGDQLVCHLSPDDVAESAEPYPRHFGVTFFTRSEFDEIVERARRRELEFVQELFVRFAGKREAHAAFFIRDPSNNVLEFKHYDDAEMMY